MSPGMGRHGKLLQCLSVYVIIITVWLVLVVVLHEKLDNNMQQNERMEIDLLISTSHKMRQSNLTIYPIDENIVTARNMTAREMDSPLIIFTCQRANYLQRTLEAVWKHHPVNKAHKQGDGLCSMAYPIVVSQDGENREVHAVVDEFMNKFQDAGVPFIHTIHSNNNLSGNQRKMHDAYRALAVHFGWALNRLFDGTTYTETNHTLPLPERVIILEEDIEVAPDFFSFMNAMAPLLESDTTLLVVSAYNDNGKRGIVSNATRAVRSDFFPGLGWMMPRRIWNEIGPKWPDAYWDDWLREPEQRRGRQIIRPEVSRTYHFGSEKGASRNQFGKELAEIELHQEHVAWEIKDGSYDYLAWDRFRQDYYSSVLKAQLSPWQDAMNTVKEGNVRVEYNTWDEFKKKVPKLLKLISTDEKAGVPRSSYEGIVETRPYGKHMLFFSPTAGTLIENFERAKIKDMAAFSETLRVVPPPQKPGCYYYTGNICSKTKVKVSQ